MGNSDHFFDVKIREELLDIFLSKTFLHTLAKREMKYKLTSFIIPVYKVSKIIRIMLITLVKGRNKKIRLF